MADPPAEPDAVRSLRHVYAGHCADGEGAWAALGVCCAELARGRRARWPLRSPGAERVVVICSRAAVDRAKRKLVPTGALRVEIAVCRGATRKRLLVRLALGIAGAVRGFGIAGGGALAWGRGCDRDGLCGHGRWARQVQRTQRIPPRVLHRGSKMGC